MNRFTTWRTIGILLLLCGLILPLSAAAQDAKQPPTKPILRIETGMHISPIRQIGMDAAQKYLVSASNDRTVRVWECATGKLLRTLRPPIGNGFEGKLYSVAISPDGQTIACAGWSGKAWDGSHSIYFFDRASGQMAHRITGLPLVIERLTYSPDNRLLVATTAGSNGVRVYRTSDYKQVLEDKNYQDGSYGADFDRSGRLATTSQDGLIRLYNFDFTLRRKVKAPEGAFPYGICFSPDGKHLTVGYFNTAKVSVLSSDDLSLLYSPAVAGVDNGDLASVCWSADGSRLYAAGDYVKGGFRQVRVWQDGGRGAASDLPAARDRVFDLLSVRQGGVVFGSGEPTLGVMADNGKLLWKQAALTADYRDNGEGFLLAGNGATVQFGYDQGGRQPARYDVEAHLLDAAPPADVAQGSLHPPRITAPGLTITDWKNNTSPKCNGALLPFESFQMSYSLAIAPDAQHFLLGTYVNLYCYDQTGKVIWEIPVPGAVWSLNIAGNGKLGAAALTDGTIRWYRMSDGAELLALFPHADKKRWVAWTPSGYYDCSVGGEDLIGWHVNNGKDAAADFFPASKFHKTLYRPDVIERILSTLDEKEALQEADAAAGQTTQLANVAALLPPVLTIPPSDAALTADKPTVKIRYTLRAPSGEPVTGLQVAVVGGAVEKGLRSLPHVPKSASEVVTDEVEVAIPPRDCEIYLEAENRFGGSVKGVVQVKWKGAAAPVPELPTLYIFAAGVNEYADKGLTLHFAAKDAADFVAAMQKQKGLLYKDVIVRLLQNEQVTRESIVQGLDWISETHPDNAIAMVFLSGHGDNDSHGHYYYVPSDCSFATLTTKGVSWSVFTEKLKDITGKALLFLDTCHAANVVGEGKKGGNSLDIDGYINELKNAGSSKLVFAACDRGESSLEDAKWENGAFTKVLLAGLSGKADTQGTHRVTVAMLNLYLAEQVPALTDRRQHPVNSPIDAGSSTTDFPLAVVSVP